MDGPLVAYRARIATGDLEPDSAQALAVEKLQSLHNALIRYEPDSGLDGWRKRFGLSQKQSDPPQGLYIFGGVGRGKSILMDMFFTDAPVARKRRVHFHEFMQQVHARLHEYRKWKRRADDPIPVLARRFADEAWLLCFDEFQVSDIADAMILGRLFESLFEYGVVIVTTSNQPPRDLYLDGLQRELFLPFIDMIEEKLDILEIDGKRDYRREKLRQMDGYIVPHDANADRALGSCFDQLSSGTPSGHDRFYVNGRAVDIPLAAGGVALAGFSDLCAQPLGPGDYLAIARRYHTLIMPGIPRLTPDLRDQAKRFVTLIDALYERRVVFICSAAVPPDEIYTRGDGSFEFERTVSRLIEMQSTQYREALRD